MARTLYKRKIFLLSYITVGIILLSFYDTHPELTSSSKNDPYPLFSTLSWDARLMLTKDQLEYKDPNLAAKKKNCLNVSITPFGQNASRGKSIRGQVCPPQLDFIVPCPDEAEVPLGDLTGRPGMFALLYGKFPDGVTAFPGSLTDDLNKAYQVFFCTACPATGPCPDGSPCVNGFCCTPPAGTLNIGGDIDPQQFMGYFSIPMEYRKRGLGLEFDALFSDTFGCRVQTRVSSIRQVVERMINETDSPLNSFQPVTPTVTKSNVDEFLMDQFESIMEDIGINTDNIIQTSIEEVRFNLFWRQIFELNPKELNSWAHFLLIPYFEAAGSFSPGKARNPSQLFAAPFGNNTHPSVGFTTGVNFDFVDSIEIGGEIGFTHFFKRNFCNYPMPTSKYQTTIFPFKAAQVSINPGNNWYFAARLAAYHFLGNLSMYFEWVVLDHKQDKIHVLSPNTNGAFLPEVLEQTTTFKVKLGNMGLNYDVSPNIGLGFLWQIPFSQRNAYRSSTIMAGINFTF